MNFNDQQRSCVVMLSEAKHPRAPRARPFPFAEFTLERSEGLRAAAHSLRVTHWYYRSWLVKIIIGQWPVDALPRLINRRCANKLCAYGVINRRCANKLCAYGVFPILVVKTHHRAGAGQNPLFIVNLHNMKSPWRPASHAGPHTRTSIERTT